MVMAKFSSECFDILANVRICRTVSTVIFTTKRFVRAESCE